MQDQKELRADLQELRSLLSQAVRPGVKAFLDRRISELEKMVGI